MDSRRLHRSVGLAFQEKEQQLKADLDMPFNITKGDAMRIIQYSGIRDWQEEWEYLKNQLSREQVGCPGSLDPRQQKRDQRKREEYERSRLSLLKYEKVEAEHEERKREFEEEEGEDLAVTTDSVRDATYHGEDINNS